MEGFGDMLGSSLGNVCIYRLIPNRQSVPLASKWTLLSITLFGIVQAKIHFVERWSLQYAYCFVRAVMTTVSYKYSNTTFVSPYSANE